MTRIAITGVTGQVGWELVRALLPLGKLYPLSREACDLKEPDSIRVALRQIAPHVIFNPAAYTAVDAAEADAATAFRINGDAVDVMAGEARHLGALLIHYSTDYVFDGQKAGRYIETDATAPLGVYGRSKLAGELALQNSGADWLCLRTSWVYSARGKNFLRTMLRLAAEREELRVVGDQVGAPTWSRLIAEVSAHVMRSSLAERARGEFRSGILHLAASGETSWHGFARAIIETATAHAASRIKATRLIEITTADYPTPAKRPANSRLNCDQLQKRFGLELPDWRQGTSLCLAEALA